MNNVERCVDIVAGVDWAEDRKAPKLLPVSSPNADRFLPRDVILARYLLSSRVCLFVCMSVCPSKPGIASKWLNLGSQKQRRTIAQRC